MHSADTLVTPRRSSRVRAAIPLIVTSLEPSAQFSESCETLVVSAHGCAVRSPIKLDPGVPVYFQLGQGRQATARVVDCQPIGTDDGWMLGARLDRPENFWGLKPCPEDWARLSAAGDGVALPGNGSPGKMPMLRALVAEMVEPLQNEIADLKDKLARRNRFEVSLTHIPPEVEEKLGIRLRQDLGKQVLEQTREQSAGLLSSAQTAIEGKIKGSEEEFHRWVGQELKAVGRRAESIAEETTRQLQTHVQAGFEEFRKHTAAAAARLQQQTEEHLRSVQQRVAQEEAALHHEIEQIQQKVASESARLRDKLGELGTRMQELDASARAVESGLNTRLSKMASDVVSAARTQLIGASDLAVEQARARNIKELSDRLEEAVSQLKTLEKEAISQLKSLQSGIQSSVSESLQYQLRETLGSYQHTVEELAQHSVGRWRQALAKDLSSVGKILGQQLRPEE